MYNYGEEKHKIFTESGVIALIKIKDHIDKILKVSGSITMENAINPPSSISSTIDDWEKMACVDFLREHNFIQEVELKQPYISQYRIFMKYNPMGV